MFSHQYELLEQQVVERIAELQEVNDLLHALIDAVPLAIDVVGLDGKVKLHNPAAEQMFGWKAEEVLGKFLPEIVSPMYQAEIQTYLDDLVAGKTISNYETQRLRKDGSYIDVSISTTALRDKTGKIIGGIGILADISERKRAEAERLCREAEKQLAEQALLEQERQLSTLISNLPGYVYRSVNDFNYTTLYISAGVFEITGYHPHEYLCDSTTSGKEIHPADRPRVWNLVQHAVQQRQPYECEYRIITRSGEQKWVWERGRGVYNDSGELLFLEGFVTDISDRKRIEAEHIEAEALIHIQKEFLSRLINTVPNLIFVKDWDGRFQLVNQATADIYQTTVENLLGKTDADFNPNLAEVEEYLAADREVMSNVLSKIILQETVTSPNGETRHFQTVKVPIWGADGKSRQILGVATDITQHNVMREVMLKTNRELTNANTELERVTRLKDEFLANMSHELRTPLNAILGMAEGLQQETFGDLNERQKQAIATIEHSGEHLLSLINDILDLAKIESGKVELQVAPVSVYQLCRSSLSLVQPQALKKNIQLTSEIQTDLRDVVLDERRMRQVLINLLDNAVKFTPEGGRVRLQVSLQESVSSLDGSTGFCQPRGLTFSVIDTGIGIASQDMEKLFQTFVQIDSSLSRRYAGTGLGLVMVKRLTEMHGGSVHVESQVGKGSHFKVQLPYRTEATPRLTMCHTAGLNAPLILLIEPQAIELETLTDYLHSWGYRLCVVTTLKEAIASLTLLSPDLILLHLQSPQMDSLRAIGQIRAEATLACQPLLALTALATSADREKYLAVGASECLVKPIRLKRLLETIQHWLQGAK